MSHMLVAAALPKQSVIALPDGTSMTLDHIHNSTPEPGKITWIDDDGFEMVIGAAQEVEVVFLPRSKEAWE